MKTSRLLMTAAILVITFASLSPTGVLKADQLSHNKFTLELTLEEALLNPDLVMTMRQQIGEDFLGNGEAPTYTAHIHFGNVHVCITGTGEEWTLFLHSPLANHTNQRIL